MSGCKKVPSRGRTIPSHLREHPSLNFRDLTVMSMSLTAREIVDIGLMHSNTTRFVRPSHKLARRETSRIAQSPREALELDHENECGLIAREGKPIPLLLPCGFQVRPARTPRDFEARRCVTHQVIRGAAPEGDINDFMSPRMSECQRRDGDSRELDLSRETRRFVEVEQATPLGSIVRASSSLPKPGMSSARMRNVCGARRSAPSITDAAARMIVSHRSRGCKIGKSWSRQCTSFIDYSLRRQPAGLIRLATPILADVVTPHRAQSTEMRCGLHRRDAPFRSAGPSLQP